MTQTMQAAVYYNNSDIRLEERPIPQIGPGDILVKTVACGLCGGEAMEWYHAPRAPKVMGHEPAGIVVQAGQNVTRFKEGDRVFVNHHVGRIQSHLSLRGHFTRDPFYNKTKLHPGAMCEYFMAPAVNVETDTHLIPAHVSFAEATVLEPWGCVVGGLKVAGIQPGDAVAVVGSGFMGIGFVHMAPLFGAGKIIALDFSDWRLEKAVELGANVAINPQKEDAVEKMFDLTGGYGADTVIVTVPNTAAWELAYSLVGTGGTLHFAAPPPGNQSWTINPEKLYFSEVTFTSKYSADHHDTYQVLRWLESGRIQPRQAITHRFPLTGIHEAFDLLLKADRSLKSIIYPNGFELEME
ncbi:MAG: zinc-binding dehydrogenase [Chloroflexota bacterium]